MRVCTLIVRLLGLGIMQLASMQLIHLRMLQSYPQFQNPFFSPVTQTWPWVFWYCVAGIAVGAVMTIFAAGVAKLLTYDAPRDG